MHVYITQTKTYVQIIQTETYVYIIQTNILYTSATGNTWLALFPANRPVYAWSRGRSYIPKTLSNNTSW